MVAGFFFSKLYFSKRVVDIGLGDMKVLEDYVFFCVRIFCIGVNFRVIYDGISVSYRDGSLAFRL